MKKEIRDKIINGIYLAVILILLLLALYISSGKVKLVFCVIAICLFVLSKGKDRIRSMAFAGVAAVFLCLNLFYNYRNLDAVNPMTQVKSQTLYQSENLENEVYPDSFLRLLIHDKTILLPTQVQLYSDYNSYGMEELEGNYFSNHYLIDNNYLRYFMVFSKGTEIDETLPENMDLNMDAHKQDFNTLGIGNDLLRYSFLLNDEGIQEATYFWYSWYYYSFAEEEEYYPGVYVNEEGLIDAEKLVALWDKEENLYLMSEDYYQEVIADEYQ